VARAIARRAERRVWALARSEEVSPELLKYLNRLSDLLLVLARVLARHERGAEVLWRHDRGGGKESPRGASPSYRIRHFRKIAPLVCSAKMSRQIRSSSLRVQPPFPTPPHTAVP